MMNVVTMPKRAKVADRGPASPLLWYDARGAAGDAEQRSLIERLAHRNYTGVLLSPADLETVAPLVPARLDLVVAARTLADVEQGLSRPGGGRVVIASDVANVLTKARAESLATCLQAYVDDNDSLHAAIHEGQRYDYLALRFRDPTNIPLELVIASLQASETLLVKVIEDPTNIEDALVSLGVMEVGADGVMYSPRDHALLDELAKRLTEAECPKVALEVGTVIRSEPVGMGYRSCIDLATLFSPDEGMLVGSTSQGGIFCCPEVFHLPYMELRPFRVNAGAVHSYVYNFGDKTDYMTELKAGSPVMVVGADGRTRRATVGRVKTEVRPLRLIEVEFAGGRRVNVLMQDDWHVRIYSDDVKPRNITELEPGDKVLGYGAHPGRHVGIKVDEHIVED